IDLHPKQIELGDAIVGAHASRFLRLSGGTRGWRSTVVSQLDWRDLAAANLRRRQLRIKRIETVHLDGVITGIKRHRRELPASVGSGVTEEVILFGVDPQIEIRSPVPAGVVDRAGKFAAGDQREVFCSEALSAVDVDIPPGKSIFAA